MSIYHRVMASSASRPLTQGTQTAAKAGPWPWGMIAGFSLPKEWPRAPPYLWSEGGGPLPHSAFPSRILCWEALRSHSPGPEQDVRAATSPPKPPTPRHAPASSGALRIVGALDREGWHPRTWRQAELLGILMQECLPAAALSGASVGPQGLASREA